MYVNSSEPRPPSSQTMNVISELVALTSHLLTSKYPMEGIKEFLQEMESFLWQVHFIAKTPCRSYKTIVYCEI